MTTNGIDHLAAAPRKHRRDLVLHADEHATQAALDDIHAFYNDASAVYQRGKGSWDSPGLTSTTGEWRMASQ
jgi:hypothetical protein